MTKPSNFPRYGAGPAKEYIDDLVRLLSTDLFRTQYVDARAGAKLLATALQTYRVSKEHPRWASSQILSKVRAEVEGRSRKFNLVCAALFDLLCNAEYIRGKKLVNRSWIYCNRHRQDGGPAHAYYSFLKQCPKCCQDQVLDPRLDGAQHKPSSHYIGEITTTATAFFLNLLASAGPRPLSVGVIGKQSHDVDAIAWRDDLLVLFEIKASPLVSYPLRTRLAQPFTEPGDDGPIEIPQHKLIDVEFSDRELCLYLANTGKDVSLGAPGRDVQWPYPQLTEHFRDPETLLDYLEAWSEIFHAYSIPKTDRRGRDVVLGYLANGWGDEIDSNKTKAGLGRTDDIKKGTYQLLKFGAYYRDGSPDLQIRGTLVANLDPIFLHRDYLERLIDGRWAPAKKFKEVKGRPEFREIPDRDLFYIYDSLLAFNRPIVNDPILTDCFDFRVAEQALLSGGADGLLAQWGLENA